jgi:hypothetical protein
MDPLLKFKYLFAHGNYGQRAVDLAPTGTAPPYVDFHALTYQSWGAVLEENWGSRAKLALESNFICQRQENNPWVKGVNALAEISYLLSYHLSLRAVDFIITVRGEATFTKCAVSPGDYHTGFHVESA